MYNEDWLRCGILKGSYSKKELERIFREYQFSESFYREMWDYVYPYIKWSHNHFSFDFLEEFKDYVDWTDIMIWDCSAGYNKIEKRKLIKKFNLKTDTGYNWYIEESN